jgi:hypothetical protein
MGRSGVNYHFTAQQTMVDPIDNIALQARQGSVAAIIQVLNEKLADAGIRTRAVFAQGMLQLLCEAEKPSDLEQTVLVERLRQLLESINPKGIRRVHIYSRIVREQQLLWLEEITRDPDHPLLWSEQIKLRKPNVLKRLLEDWQQSQPDYKRPVPQSLSRSAERKQQYWRGIVGGASLSLLVVLGGWLVLDWLEIDMKAMVQTWIGVNPETPDADRLPASSSIAESPIPVESPAVASPNTPDSFVQAVRIAEQAAIDGQTAQSAADWLDLATRWQRAADLMAEVQSNDPRYSTAQERSLFYQQNSAAALQKAEASRQREAQ